MRRRWMTLWAAAALLMAGCVEKRVTWSPDGRYGAVIGGDGLYLCDPTGALSERVAPHAARAAWFPDSTHLAVVRTEEVTEWQRVVEHVGEATQARLIEAAKAAEQELMAYQGSLDDFEPKTLESLTPGEAVAATLYLRDHMSAEAKAKVQQKWDNLDDMSAQLCSIEIIEVSEGRGKVTRTILRQLDDCGGLAVSPDGRFIACISAMPLQSGSDYKLVVVPTDGGGGERPVAERVATHCDWTADGRNVIYAYSASPAPEGDSMRLGAVAKRKVRGDDGALLEKFEDAVDLAGVVFDGMLKLRRLPDNRVIFSSMEVRLPATVKEMPQQGTLFAVVLDSPATVVKVLPPDVESRVASGIPFFEVSPDGSKVSIPGEDGVCSIITLASGELTQVNIGDGGDELRTVPVWRTNEELCMAVPAGSKYASEKRAEIVLWSPSVVRTISKDWPEAVAGEWLSTDESAKETTPDPAEPTTGG